MISLDIGRPEPAQGRARGLRIEHRQTGGYEQSLLSAFVDSATGAGADVSMAAALSSVEVAAGLWARGLASARVSPENTRTKAITASVRARIGRELARRGECVFAIDVDGSGTVSLGVAGFWDVFNVAGSFTSWQYRVSRYGPSSTLTKLIPAAGVAHIMYASSPARPWAGRSPIAFCFFVGCLRCKIRSGAEV